MVDLIANNYKKCLYVHYQKQLFIKAKLTSKGRVLPRHCYKERKEGVIDAIDELGNGFSIEVCI